MRGKLKSSLRSLSRGQRRTDIEDIMAEAKRKERKIMTVKELDLSTVLQNCKQSVQATIEGNPSAEQFMEMIKLREEMILLLISLVENQEKQIENQKSKV